MNIPFTMDYDILQSNKNIHLKRDNCNKIKYTHCLSVVLKALLCNFWLVCCTSACPLGVNLSPRAPFVQAARQLFYLRMGTKKEVECLSDQNNYQCPSNSKAPVVLIQSLFSSIIFQVKFGLITCPELLYVKHKFVNAQICVWKVYNMNVLQCNK